MLRNPFQMLAVGLVGVAASACEPPALQIDGGLPSIVSTTQERDFELEVCRARIAEVRSQPSLPGTPTYDANRPAILGRAVGEPAVFVTEPPPALDPPDAGAHGSLRVSRVKRAHRFDKPAMRARLLRDGYVYASEPHEAYALVRELTLQELFDEETIFLQRGETTHALEKERARFTRGHEYRHADGAAKGRVAKVVFGDRVALTREELAVPLHRDVRALRARVGFERIRIQHRAEDTLVADVRFDGQWYGALLTSDGAHLDVACIDADRASRTVIAQHAAGTASRRRAVAALQASADALVAERLPFDRPRGAEDHFDDGQLRSRWEWAYKRGAFSFSHDEEGYLVFDADGQPHPPQTCVEMVLDSYERASGNWFQPKAAPRVRKTGGLNFSDYGIKSRNGVLAFEKFAEKTPELFVHRRFPQAERVAFKHREAFFTYLVEHADDFAPGDIVAIQGLKRDGHIHQHAILIQDTDPVTGMPHALTDQMKRPRHRTWEGIMAEAPLRSLLYHVKPTPALMAKLDRERAATATQLTARQ